MEEDRRDPSAEGEREGKGGIMGPLLYFAVAFTIGILLISWLSGLLFQGR